jgi:DNA adenine methylase
MASIPHADQLKEAIEKLKKDFLDSIPVPPRPMAPFRWAGGKGNLAQWIIQYVPDGHIYVEPFAGAASVFWHLPKPFPVEVLNDLDGDIVNLYRVLQDKTKFEELAHKLIFTPYARAEFIRALQIAKDPTATDVDRAWAFFVKQNQGFSGIADTPGNWSRVLTSKSNDITDTTSKWRSRLKLLSFWHERLSRVQIDCIDGIECIKYWDTPETVFYIDPPYVPDTRKSRRLYKDEPDLAYHERLLDAILTAKGKVLLSCYDHPVYAPLSKAGWHRLVKKTVCHMARKIRASNLQGPRSAKTLVPRTETLYLNFSLPQFATANLFETN